MLFTEWLKNQRDRQDPVGDLARDVAEDARTGCLPGGAAGWPLVTAHLMADHEMCEGARDALDAALREYQAVIADRPTAAFGETALTEVQLAALSGPALDLHHALVMAASMRPAAVPAAVPARKG